MIQNIPTYDLEIKCGEDFSFSFYLKDENGTLQDLTGKTFYAQLREFAESSKAIDFTCQHNNAGGTVTIALPHAKTSQIRFLNGVYDVIQIDGDDTRVMKLCGSVTIIPAVTR